MTLKIFMLIISLLVSANTVANTKLKIAYTNFPPFIWEEGGEVKGIYVDILTEALEKRMQVKISFQALSYKRILGQLENANIDAFVDVSTPELLTLTKPGTVPVAVGMVGAFAHKNHPQLSELNQVNRLTELKNYRLLSYQNDRWAHQNLQEFNVDDGTKDIANTLQKLAKNRGDIFLQIEQVGQHYINQLNFKNDFVQLSNFTTSPYIYQFNLSQQSQYLDILPRLDSTLTVMINDGTMDAIYAAYHLTQRPKNDRENQKQASIIKLIHYWSGPMKSGMNKLMDRFNDTYQHQHHHSHQEHQHHFQHHQLQSFAMDHESFKQVIKLMLFGDSRADIYSNWAGARTQFLVDSGNLESVDDIWQEEKLNQRFSQVTADASTYNAKKYAIPVTQHLAVFFYNKHIFKKYNLTPPRSWKAFLKLGDALLKEGVTPIALGAKDKWPAQFWFDYLLLRTAGPEYREALMKGEASYTDREVKKVYQLWKGLIDKGFFNKHPNQLTWTQAAGKVYQEEAAMTLMGTWLIRYFENEFNWQENSDYGFFVFPRLNASVPDVNVGPIDVMVKVKGSNDSATKHALLFLAELESQKILSKGSGSLAPNNNIPVSFYSPMKQALLAVTESTKHWAFNYDLATPPAVSEIGLSSFALFLEQPNDYEVILREVQEAVDKYYKAINNSTILAK